MYLRGNKLSAYPPHTACSRDHPLSANATSLEYVYDDTKSQIAKATATALMIVFFIHFACLLTRSYTSVGTFVEVTALVIGLDDESSTLNGPFLFHKMRDFLHSLQKLRHITTPVVQDLGI